MLISGSISASCNWSVVKVRGQHKGAGRGGMLVAAWETSTLHRALSTSTGIAAQEDRAVTGHVSGAATSYCTLRIRLLEASDCHEAPSLAANPKSCYYVRRFPKRQENIVHENVPHHGRSRVHRQQLCPPPLPQIGRTHV